MQASHPDRRGHRSPSTDALKLVARLPRSLLPAVDDQPDDDLAAYANQSGAPMTALARKPVLDSDRGLVSGETDSEPIEDIFARAQQIAAEAEDQLVDTDWQRPVQVPEPMVAALPGDGDVGPIVELAPCGGDHGSSEPQQTLFSGAEFLAEQPDQPKPRGRNPRTSRPSLFDWALEREQEAGLAAGGGYSARGNGGSHRQSDDDSLHSHLCGPFCV